MPHRRRIDGSRIAAGLGVAVTTPGTSAGHDFAQLTMIKKVLPFLVSFEVPSR
jgi:hypothetical protein